MEHDGAESAQCLAALDLLSGEPVGAGRGGRGGGMYSYAPAGVSSDWYPRMGIATCHAMLRMVGQPYVC